MMVFEAAHGDTVPTEDPFAKPLCPSCYDTSLICDRLDPFINTWLKEISGVRKDNIVLFPMEGGMITCSDKKIVFYRYTKGLGNCIGLAFNSLLAGYFLLTGTLKTGNGSLGKGIALLLCSAGCGAQAFNSFLELKEKTVVLCCAPEGLFLFGNKVASWPEIASVQQERRDVVNESGQIVSSIVCCVMSITGGTLMCIPKYMLPVSIEQMIDLTNFYLHTYGVRREFIKTDL